MDRERISITVRKSLLRKLDRTVDGAKIRNRSHAIEYYLSQALSPRVSKAVILAGGPGTQMRPLTYEVPKALIPVHGKPLLTYTIELLKRYHIRNIILSIGHLGEKIREHFGNGEAYGVRITYVNQEGVVGTGGALAAVDGLVGRETFLMIHGDLLVDIDLDDMISFHQESDFLASIALTSTADISAYGAVQVQRNRVVAFSEKSRQGKFDSQLINAGVYIMEPQIFDFIPEGRPCSLEQDVFAGLARDKQLGGYVFAGDWHDVSTPEAYDHALKRWQTAAE
jgi:NDP-sugar pyrophosphorylase family protein